MKFFRYRRPSLKTLLGVTKAKKEIKKKLGITALLKPFRWWPNKKRQIKREIGYESDAGRLIRDGLPKPGGCLVVVMVGIGLGVACVIIEMSISPDGHMVGRCEGEVEAKAFLGAAEDLIRNIHGVAPVAGLDGDEVGYLVGKVAEVKRMK